MIDEPSTTTNDASAIDDNYVTSCEVCGAALTSTEQHEIREFGRPSLCATHLAEQVPAEDLAREQGGGGDSAD